MHISYSRESVYLRCPYAHYLRYVDRLQPKRPARPLIFGSDFHKLLELRGDEQAIEQEKERIAYDFENMPKKYQAELGENYPKDLTTIFDDYQKVYAESPLPDVTEQIFEFKLGTYQGESIYFKGVIDGIYYRDEGAVIEEHKTFSRKPDQNTLVMNIQKNLYAKVLEKTQGERPKAVLWDYIKSTPAKEPIFLEKSKKFSLAKSEQITPYSFMRACESRGVIDAKEVHKGMEQYASNTQNFFFRVEMDYIPKAVDETWEDFIYIAKDICKNGHKNKTKHITKDCAWCEFQPVCRSELTNGDTKGVLQNEYKQY